MKIGSCVFVILGVVLCLDMAFAVEKDDIVAEPDLKAADNKAKALEKSNAEKKLLLEEGYVEDDLENTKKARGKGRDPKEINEKIGLDDKGSIDIESLGKEKSDEIMESNRESGFRESEEDKEAMQKEIEAMRYEGLDEEALETFRQERETFEREGFERGEAEMEREGFDKEREEMAREGREQQNDRETDADREAREREQKANELQGGY